MTSKGQWVPNLKDCPPSLLRTLVAFAELGSVSQVATALRLSQSDVSRRLKAFWKKGDAGALVERAGERRLRLTTRGAALLPRIREVVTRYEELLAHLLGEEEVAEVVRAALGSFAVQIYLPRVLARLPTPRPWRLETKQVRGRERILGVAEGHYDLAVVTHAREDIKRLAGGQALAVERLARHPVVAIAHPESGPGVELAATSSDRPLPLEKLAAWPLVGLDEQSGLRRKLEERLRGRGQLAHALEGHPGGWNVGREYARQQIGVALLPLPLVTPSDREDFVVRRLADAFVIEDYLAVRAEKLTTAQAEVVGHFKQAARTLARG